jgi:phosphoenolpyruvate carboxykinase (ATP)
MHNYNLTRDELIKHALDNNEGVLASNGALRAETGSRTGRSTKDRFIVHDDLTEDSVDWGVVNQPVGSDTFDSLWQKAQAFVKDKQVFTQDLQVGACDEHHVQVRVVTQYAWHALFTKNLFIESSLPFEENTSWTLLSAPELATDPDIDGVNGDAALMINFTQRKVLLCGLRYAGEMKKAMFSVMNFLMPEADVLPMHCASNKGDNGSVALFFGLSGTGKTTLSADPDRFLIGDDEHGWSYKGVFNFEGGCYAKCIDLSQKNEPVIYDAICSGAIMENVVLDKDTAEPDYKDDSLTQNTRCAYPRSHIEKSVDENAAGHPSAVVFLTCDLYGVLPPVAKLTKEQAAYHFLSGYTALVGSTEVGGGSDIKPVFSQCFGAPFFPRSAQVYADLLMKRIDETEAQVYLVNTGWSGGACGQGGERFAIPVTRAVVSAITNGDLENVECDILPGFDFMIPKQIPGVADELVNPKSTWSSQEAYLENLNKLIDQFQENFAKFSVSDNIKDAGPTN